MLTISIYFQGGLVWESGRFLSNVYNSIQVASPKMQGGIEICAAIHTKIIQFSGSLPENEGGLALASFWDCDDFGRRPSSVLIIVLLSFLPFWLSNIHHVAFMFFVHRRDNSSHPPQRAPPCRGWNLPPTSAPWVLRAQMERSKPWTTGRWRTPMTATVATSRTPHRGRWLGRGRLMSSITTRSKVNYILNTKLYEPCWLTNHLNAYGNERVNVIFAQSWKIHNLVGYFMPVVMTTEIRWLISGDPLKF